MCAIIDSLDGGDRVDDGPELKVHIILLLILTFVGEIEDIDDGYGCLELDTSIAQR